MEEIITTWYKFNYYNNNNTESKLLRNLRPNGQPHPEAWYFVLGQGDLQEIKT